MLASIIKKSRFNISCRIVRFPLFMPNIPLFSPSRRIDLRAGGHHSIRPIKEMAEKKIVILSESQALRAGGQQIVEIPIHSISLRSQWHPFGRFQIDTDP